MSGQHQLYKQFKIWFIACLSDARSVTLLEMVIHITDRKKSTDFRMPVTSEINRRKDGEFSNIYANYSFTGYRPRFVGKFSLSWSISLKCPRSQLAGYPECWPKIRRRAGLIVLSISCLSVKMTLRNLCVKLWPKMRVGSITLILRPKSRVCNASNLAHPLLRNLRGFISREGDGPYLNG